MRLRASAPLGVRDAALSSAIVADPDAGVWAAEEDAGVPEEEDGTGGLVTAVSAGAV